MEKEITKEFLLRNGFIPVNEENSKIFSYVLTDNNYQEIVLIDIGSLWEINIKAYDPKNNRIFYRRKNDIKDYLTSLIYTITNFTTKLP